jgi:hypothetical protein
VRESGGGRAGEASTLAKAREGLPDPAKVDGELAAKIFDGLNRGVSTVQLVVDHQVHPDLVEAFQVQWARMNNKVVVSEQAIEELASHRGYVGVVPVRSEEQLLDSIRESLDHALCGCGEAQAVTCHGCGRRERERVAAKVEARVRAEYEGEAGGMGVALGRMRMPDGRGGRRRHPDPAATFRPATRGDREEPAREEEASDPEPRIPPAPRRDPGPEGGHRDGACVGDSGDAPQG